jgi:hypothetical protein
MFRTRRSKAADSPKAFHAVWCAYKAEPNQNEHRVNNVRPLNFMPLFPPSIQSSPVPAKRQIREGTGEPKIGQAA